MDDWRSPLLDLPDAVAADPPDAGVAAHYGDPLREQRHLVEDAGFVDRSNCGVVRVGGPDRLSWLHSLTTQHVEHLAAWRGAEALVLDPHGRVEHHLLLADDGESSWLDVEPGTAGALAAYLDSMRFMLRVEVADVSGDWAIVTVAGPDTDALLGADAPGGTAYDVRARGSGGFVRRRRWPAGAVDVLTPRADLAPLEGAAPAGTEAFEALRVAAREPRLRRETDDRTIPHEVGWLATAVHLDKGCYRGQETVARVHNLGRPPRRLVLLHLDGTEVTLPVHGDPVTADGRAVGTLGTAARHHDLGPIALAVIKRNVPDETALVVAGTTAAAIEPGGEEPVGDRPPRPRPPRLSQLS